MTSATTGRPPAELRAEVGSKVVLPVGSSDGKAESVGVGIQVGLFELDASSSVETSEALAPSAAGDGLGVGIKVIAAEQFLLVPRTSISKENERGMTLSRALVSTSL